MAIPEKPLVIVDFDPDKRTIKEHRSLWGSRYSIEQFADFLVEHVDHEKSWTNEEIDAITVDELNTVRTQVQAALVEMEKTKSKNEGEDTRPLPESKP